MNVIYVSAVDASTAEVVPPQPFPTVPSPGSVIEWRESYVVRDEPVVWRRRELIRGNTQWVAVVAVDLVKPTQTRPTRAKRTEEK